MNELNVRIVKLEPMRVASFHGFGTSPEHQAAENLIAWAGPKGLLDAGGKHRIFGFDNPCPSPGSPNYGYEFWITIEPHVKPEEAIEIKYRTHPREIMTKYKPGMILFLDGLDEVRDIDLGRFINGIVHFNNTYETSVKKVFVACRRHRWESTFFQDKELPCQVFHISAL